MWKISFLAHFLRKSPPIIIVFVLHHVLKIFLKSACFELEPSRCFCVTKITLTLSRHKLELKSSKQPPFVVTCFFF